MAKDQDEQKTDQEKKRDPEPQSETDNTPREDSFGNKPFMTPDQMVCPTCGSLYFYQRVPVIVPVNPRDEVEVANSSMGEFECTGCHNSFDHNQLTLIRGKQV